MAEAMERPLDLNDESAEVRVDSSSESDEESIHTPVQSPRQPAARETPATGDDRDADSADDDNNDRGAEDDTRDDESETSYDADNSPSDTPKRKKRMYLEKVCPCGRVFKKGIGRHALSCEALRELRKAPHFCTACGTVDAATWLTGPKGMETICNRCYPKWRRAGKPLDGEFFQFSAPAPADSANTDGSPAIASKSPNRRGRKKRRTADETVTLSDDHSASSGGGRASHNPATPANSRSSHAAPASSRLEANLRPPRAARAAGAAHVLPSTTAPAGPSSSLAGLPGVMPHASHVNLATLDVSSLPTLNVIGMPQAPTSGTVAAIAEALASSLPSPSASPGVAKTSSGRASLSSAAAAGPQHVTNSPNGHGHHHQALATQHAPRRFCGYCGEEFDEAEFAFCGACGRRRSAPKSRG